MPRFLTHFIPRSLNTLGGGRAWLIWVIAATFYLYEFAVRVAPGVMVDEIQSFYHIDSAGFGSAMAAYYHIYGPMQILVGLLLDYFGGRYILTLASLCVALGCFMPLFGESIYLLTAARAMMGFGSAFAFVGTMYLATIWFPRNRLAFIAGISTALGMAGAIVGQAPLAGIVNWLGWQNTFWYAGFIGIIVAVALYFAIPAQASPLIEKREADLAQAEERVFTKGLWAVVKNPQCWVIGFVACALYAPLSIFADLWGTEYIQAITGAPRVEAAGASSMLYVGWLVAGPFAGALSDYSGKRRMPLIVASILTTLMLFVFFSFSHMSIELAYVCLLLTGIFSSMQVICFVVNTEISPHYARGNALAMTNMVVMLLGGVFQSVVGLILKLVSATAPAISLVTSYSAYDFRLAMMILPVIGSLGVFSSYLIREKAAE